MSVCISPFICLPIYLSILFMNNSRTSPSFSISNIPLMVPSRIFSFPDVGDHVMQF